MPKKRRLTLAAVRQDGLGGAHRVVRVAYIVHTFEMGGLERCVARLCNHLDRDRLRPMVVCLSRSGAAADWIERDDVPIIELRKRDGNDPLLVRRLARALNEHRVDIVHSHNWGTLVETSLARRWARVPVHVHAERGTLMGDLNGGGLRGRLRAAAARWAMNRADYVVTVAESVRQKLTARCGRLRTPVQVIPNGVDAPTVSMSETQLVQRRQTLGIAREAIVLGSVGRLVPVKDFGNAIDAVSELRRRGHDVHLILVGDGPEHDRLAARADERGIADRVRLVGRQEDVGNWLAMMDIYLNVSLSEGMSQSILEAMAAGLPMVVTDVGDNAILVDGEDPCGLVVPPASSVAIAAAAANLLEGSVHRLKLSRNGRARYARCYTADAMIQAYQHLYSELHAASPTQ